MIFLVLCIFTSVMIYVSFRLIEKYKSNLFAAIIWNYFAATITSVLTNVSEINSTSFSNHGLIIISIVIGALFIGMFYFIGYTTQKAGISITTIASKMSVVIPITFSIFYDTTDNIEMLKILGIALALPAVFLTIFKKNEQEGKINYRQFFLPVMLFLGMGFVDSVLKLAQNDFVDETNISFFSALVFFVSLSIGLLISVFSRKKIKIFFKTKTILLGILLGLSNFSSLFFFVNALESGVFSSSVVFGINNIGIVGIGVLVAMIFFGEKLSRLNWLGIALSMLAIFLLSYTKI